jgi:hypothetical protein
MIVATAVLVALACVIASARRLWLIANPTAVHPDDVVAALGRSPTEADLARVREAVDREPSADWERDLLAAIATPEQDARVALVNEQLTELDLRMDRWSRVPRVCASVATSVGILLGTMVLRNALAGATDLTGELGELFVRQVLNDAISVASFGIVATVFCIAAHAHARRTTRARLQAADRMIEKLESLRT